MADLSATASSPLPPAFPPAQIPIEPLPDSPPFGPTPRATGPSDQPVDLPLGNDSGSAEPNPVLVGQPGAVPAAPLPTVSATSITTPTLSGGISPAQSAGPVIQEEPKHKANWVMWVVVAALLVLVAIGGLYALGRTQIKKTSVPLDQTSATDTTTTSGGAATGTTTIDTTGAATGATTGATTGTEALPNPNP